MAVAVAALTGTAGCSTWADLTAEAEPPELRATWTIPGLDMNPEHVGPHHWATLPMRRNGVGWGTTWTAGAVAMVDARTGKATHRRLPGDGRPCAFPRTISPDGLVVVTLPSGRGRINACNRVMGLDAATGRPRWVTDDVDLSPLALPRRERHVVLGADDDVVALARIDGDAVCLDSSHGGPVESDDAACRALADRLTHADLPALTDLDGEPVPLTADGLSDTTEIGRTDEVLLVETLVPDDTARGAIEVVRAHDLETGETLWEKSDLELDPHGDATTWNRRERYFVAPSGIARVSYDYVEGPSEDPEELTASEDAEPDYDLTESQVSVEELTTTPMVITAVDPRTGEDLETVATMEGAWFAGQFSDMTVALTDQEQLFRSTISGFELPRW